MISQQIYFKKMMYVPEFVALYEIFPYIEYLPLNNETIRVAVKNYLEGGMKKDVIVKRYGPIEKWDTSKVTDMNNLFYFAKNFNQDISNWDTSKVTDMSRMFNTATKFNQYIGDWNVSKVTDMKFMFNTAKSFDLENAPWYHE